MKKLLFIFASAALLFAGCAKEAGSPIADEGGEATVRFNVGMPEALTKATFDNDGNAAKANHWVLEIRDAQGAVFFRDVKTAPEGTLQQTFEASLIKNQTYDLLFWADNVTNGTAYYNTADLTNVSLTSPATYVANNDARDAFSACKTYTSTENECVSVELYRPFAQVNVITTDLETLWQQALTTSDPEATYSKFEPENFVAKVKVPTSFNVQSQQCGQTSEEKIVMTSEKSYTGYLEDKKTAQSKNNYCLRTNPATLFMDYVFASKGQKDIVDIDFEFISKSVAVNFAFTSIPVQANYRTNIIGKLMSNETKFTVEIKPAWDGEYWNESWAPGMVTPITPDGSGVYNVETPSQLAWISEQVKAGVNFDGKTVKLANDIDLNNGLWTPIGNNTTNFCGTFDGNGKTISNLKVSLGKTEEPAGLFGYLSNGVIKNLTIVKADISATTPGGVAAVVGRIFNTGNVEGVTVKNANLCANRRAGAIVGYNYGAIKNCNVEEISVAITPDVVGGGYFDNGDKAGALIGFSASDNNNEISGNSAKKVLLSGFRDLGGIAGYANGEKVTGNTVQDIEIYADRTIRYCQESNANCGEIVGNTDGKTLGTGNSFSGKKQFTILENAVEKKLFEAESGDEVVVDTDTKTINIPATIEDNVTIKQAAGVVVEKITIPAGADVKNLVVKDFTPELEAISGTDFSNGFLDISKDAKVENLVIKDCNFVGPGTKNRTAIFIEPSATGLAKSIEIQNCSCTGTRYFVYTSGQIPGTTIKLSGCTATNMKSWAILINNGDVSGLDIQDCTFEGGDIVKVLDTNKDNNFVFTFKNNTITGTTANFTVKAKAENTFISGNTKNGASWNPTIGTL